MEQTLAQIVKQTVMSYVGGGVDHEMYGFGDDTAQVYAIIAVDFPVHRRQPTVVMMARIAGQTVIIEEDRTDRPLADALIAAGIAEAQVVRPGVGEDLPDAHPHPFPKTLLAG
jgi:hypothetical protein